MFKAEMIAPCGLDCNICAQALIEDDPCQGCNGPNDHKPEFCAKYCGIILCRKRKENGYRYCDECPDYPCEDVMEKENRYTSRQRSEHLGGLIERICEKTKERELVVSYYWLAKSNYL